MSACVRLWCRAEDGEQRLARVIAKSGHAVVPITTSFPPITFTIGMMHSYSHPELIMIGVAVPHAQKILNHCAALIKNGSTLELETPHDTFANMPVVFRPTNPLKSQRFLGRFLLSMYGNVVPPMLQIIWPDNLHRFLWEPDYDRQFNILQPHLWGEVTPQPVRLV